MPNETFYPVSEPDLSGNEEKYVLDAVRSGWVSSMGPYIRRFEEGFATYCGTRLGVATSNGTCALHLALASLGIGAGDEVIVPSLTFVATANAVTYTGACPVFVDCEEETWCMDPVAVQRAISSKTKGIIAVHLYGHPADMDAIKAVAAPRCIPVIEDAAEAHGALYKGRKVGGLGAIGVFSFYGNKLITTGEGGMLVTDDDDIIDRARFLRDHAMSPDRRYWHPEIGYNYRMTNLQAALGVAQLERLDYLLARKREIFGQYEDFLKGLKGFRLNPERSWARNAFWLTSMVLDEHMDRDNAMIKLRHKGIDSRPFFSPIHDLPPYRNRCRAVGKNGEDCPVSKNLASRGMNLPSGHRLERSDIQNICEALLEVLH
jgi:perosamine synthetase